MDSAAEDQQSETQPASTNLDREYLNFALGLVYAKQEKYMNAIRHLRNVVTIDEHNEQAYEYLGECCAAIGLHKEAESFLSKASKLDPHYLQPMISLGRLHYDQRDYHKAIAAIERYREVRAELAGAGGQDVEGGRDPEAELMYELLGMSYREIGDRAKSTEIWEEALKINPNRADAYATMGSLSFD